MQDNLKVVINVK